MSIESKIRLMENRVKVLEERPKENMNIVKKIKRQISNLSKSI